MSIQCCSVRSLAICVLLIAGFASQVTAQVGKPEGLYYKSWGLIIGIENYAVAPAVPGAIERGKEVAGALRRLGFDEIIELYDKDAASKRMLQMLTDHLPRKVGRQDRVVIFFAGHAGVASDTPGKELGYLVPWDAQPTNVTKSVTVDQLKEFSRRIASKHILFLLDVGIKGWEVTAPQQLSLEGRAAPEEDTEKRAVQVLVAAEKGEPAAQDGRSLFVTTLITGLQGSADLNKNGWLMGSELGTYVQRRVEELSKGAQRPQFVQLDGDGDTILIEGKKAAFQLGAEPQSQEDRSKAARSQYEQAFSLLQQQKSAEEALERLDRAIAYDPTFGDAYVLKSYVRLEVLPNIDEALTMAKLAVQHAPENPDSFYTLGLVLEKRGQYAEAEQAMRQALKVNPDYVDVYFSLGTLYADRLHDQPKAVEAFKRYLELGG
ncbi:MAG TPA: tetratricopeptide repeat protein, partial [Nitrospiraceae bacterium]|nr:tetratricopeptide repeat protein [Nitrospiraceae bacterium]